MSKSKFRTKSSMVFLISVITLILTLAFFSCGSDAKSEHKVVQETTQISFADVLSSYINKNILLGRDYRILSEIGKDYFVITSPQNEKTIIPFTGVNYLFIDSNGELRVYL